MARPAGKGEFGPFSPNAPDSIILADAPLARVLCQIRWPELTQLSRDFDAAAQDLGAKLADRYPLYALRQQANFIIGPNINISSTPGVSVYQWTSADGAFNVHFSQTFLTIETQRYTNKEDLIERLEDLLTTVVGSVTIPVCSRIGYRYTNRGTDVDIGPLLRVEVRGGEAVPTRDGVDLVQSVTETVYRIDGDFLLARWARLPAGATMDPTLEPVPSASWVLDLDAYNETMIPFDPGGIAKAAFRLAARGYTFFRWSVTDQFLATFGGESAQ